MLIDVRTLSEWQEGHIDGAALLPLQDIVDGVMPDARKDEPLFVYCRSGARAGMAVDVLKRQGYSQAKNIGGLEDAAQYGEIVQGDR